VYAFLAPLFAAASLAPPVSVTPIGVGRAPCGNAFGFGFVWVGVSGANAVARVDPKTNRVRGYVDVGPSPCGVSIGAGSVWVEDYDGARIDRVNPKKMKVVARIKAGSHVWDVLYAAGAVWATNHDAGQVERINPRTNKVVARIKTGGHPANLTYAFGAVWAGSNTGDRFFRIDPATNALTSIPVPGQEAPGSITADGSSLWVSNRDSATVSRYDVASNALVATVAVGRGPAVSAFGSDGTLFVPNGVDNTISRIDPATATVLETADRLPRTARRPLVARRPVGGRQHGARGQPAAHPLTMPATDFDFLQGRWTIDNVLYRDGVETEFPGEHFGVVKHLGGLANTDECHFEPPAPRHPFRGMSLRLLDPASEEWSIYWINDTTVQLSEPVRGAFSGAVGTFHGPADPADGREWRFIWTGVDTETPHWEQGFSTDGGASWTTDWTMDFRPSTQ
jgi:YVTN family beta-propeller protein